jgi:hypothetical protein
VLKEKTPRLICYEVPKSHEANDLNGIENTSVNYESRRGWVPGGWLEVSDSSTGLGRHVLEKKLEAKY